MNKPKLYLDSFSDINNNIGYGDIQECFEALEWEFDRNEFSEHIDTILCDVSRKRGDYDTYSFIVDHNLEAQYDRKCYTICRDVRSQLWEARISANLYLIKWSPRKVENNQVFEYLNIRPIDIGIFIENDVKEIIKWACNNICFAAHTLLDMHWNKWKNT